MNALFYHLKPGEFEALVSKRRLMGHALYLSALRLKEDELLIVASSHVPEQAIERYGLKG